MKKKLIIGVIVFIVFMVSFIIPVNSMDVWVNDDDIADIGHYEIHHKNIYGITLKITEK